MPSLGMPVLRAGLMRRRAAGVVAGLGHGVGGGGADVVGALGLGAAVGFVGLRRTLAMLALMLGVLGVHLTLLLMHGGGAVAVHRFFGGRDVGGVVGEDFELFLGQALDGAEPGFFFVVAEADGRAARGRARAVRPMRWM